MRIGLIADYLDFQLTGLGNYAYNLISKLLEIDKINEYTLVHTKRSNIKFCRRIKEIIVPPAALPGLRSTVLLPRVIKKEKFDIVHDLAGYWPPFFFNTSSKTIVTRHDMMIFLFKNLFNDFQSRFIRYTLPIIFKKIDHIIADSKSTRNDIVRLFNIPKEKISVVYLAPSDEYRVVKNSILNDFRERYALPSNFILFVGDIALRKNIITLIKSFYKLKKKLKESIYKLVLTGRKTREFGRIFEEVKSLNLVKDVIFLGYFPKSDLPLLYNAADLFVTPSIYEGFTLTPLEAMACGTPVITSNTNGFPEVVEDAGIMVDPYDIDNLANMMYKVLTDDELKYDMIRRGLRRINKLSWRKTAKKTVEVYNKVLGT